MLSSLFLYSPMLLLLFTASYLQPAVSKHNNFTDLSALLAFKAHVSDPHGIISTTWTTNISFCSWTGVSCSRRRQRVTGLDLRGLSLVGTIAPHLGNLSFMSQLNLSNNSLHGPIPDSIGKLSRLIVLYLESNYLSGPIPTAVFNMPSISRLSLAINNLSGPLPFANHDNNNISMLPQLQRFWVSNNQITGRIPSSFGQCRNLQILSLSYNQFSGNIPWELGKLAKLNILYLGVNNLTGLIPSSLGNLTELTVLQVGANKLHGGIPPELGNLVNLQNLILAENKLTGPIPASLFNASAHVVFDLHFNRLTGPVPVTVGNNMPLLEYFNLANNQLTAGLHFITSLSNCRKLQYLVVSSNHLDGIVPDSIGNLSTSLQFLIAFNNRIKRSIPPSLGNLTNLLDLRLSFNELTGELPRELTRLQKLGRLYLGYNKIQGSIPWEFGYFNSLGELTVEANLLSGSIPNSFGNLTKIQRLDLGNNNLSSDIPKSIWNLRGLLLLDLSYNSLGGVLPMAVGNLRNLILLRISSNRLSGSIPDTFQGLQMLQQLNLSQNSFQGFIPQTFGKLINIESIDLSKNALFDGIPKSLAGLRYLSKLNLSFNRLEGQIPDEGVFRNITIQSLMGNTALCGAPHLQFPPCSENFNDSKSKKGTHKLRYIIPIIIASMLLFVACFGVVLIFRRRRRKTRPLVSNGLPQLKDHTLISYYELVRATDNFNEANLVGRGSFGSVFKGQLDNSLIIAVKVLNLEIQGASESFEAECRALSMLRHRNLVKIITTCSNLDFKALVLQFMPNGSLDRWLYSHNYFLSLIQRVNIMMDVALALEYLHHGNPEVVVHCDLKPCNVLLNEEMTAHVCDFGIAKLLLGDCSKSLVSATTPGTIGYIPPEYGSTGRISRSGDVYSYGILILETFTRKRPTDAMFDGELSLRQWASDAYPSAVLEIVDCSLSRDESRSYGDELREGGPVEHPDATYQCLSSIVELGLWCSRESPNERIKMTEAVPRLNKIKMEYLLKLASNGH